MMIFMYDVKLPQSRKYNLKTSIPQKALWSPPYHEGLESYSASLKLMWIISKHIYSGMKN